MARLLRRRHVRIERFICIGKEPNWLEEVGAGLEPLPENVYRKYSDPRRGEWTTTIIPELRGMPLRLLQEKTDMSRRAIMDWEAEGAGRINELPPSWQEYCGANRGCRISLSAAKEFCVKTPDWCQSVLLRFDKSTEPLNETEIADALLDARKTQGDLNDGDCKAFTAEKSAFLFIETDAGKSVWETYFAAIDLLPRN